MERENKKRSGKKYIDVTTIYKMKKEREREKEWGRRRRRRRRDMWKKERYVGEGDKEQ